MVIRVQQGKGEKDRYTLLVQRTLEVLRDYWRAYRPKDWLFPGQPAKGSLSVSSVQKIFEKILHEARVKKHATVHTLRHSFATHLLEAGVDLYHKLGLLWDVRIVNEQGVDVAPEELGSLWCADLA